MKWTFLNRHLCLNSRGQASLLNSRGQASLLNSRGQASLLNSRGQASLVIALMLGTFLLFFAFVINIGMLVHAKINLQNAADLAAYTGASVQARQMNNIAALNYEMRRQYKKFLYRYYILGNYSLKTAPDATESNPNSKTIDMKIRKWAADTAGTDIGVPRICSFWNKQDNYCQNEELSKLAVPPASSMDSLNSSVRDTMLQIQDQKEKNCREISMINDLIVQNWLYSTDDTGEGAIQELQKNGGNATDIARLQIIKGLIQDLGVVPTLLLLNQRISVLEKHYLNRVPIKISVGDNSEIENLRKLPENERTVLSYLTAKETLGRYIFQSPEGGLDFGFEEILPNVPPPSGGSSQGQPALFKLKPIVVSFDTFGSQFFLKNNSSQPPQQSPGSDCAHNIVSVPVRQVRLGFTKDTSVETYYAVKLKANARILFNPFGDGSDNKVPMEAYAAAVPFGSRIGPENIDAKHFTYEIKSLSQEARAKLNPDSPDNVCNARKVGIPMTNGSCPKGTPVGGSCMIDIKPCFTGKVPNLPFLHGEEAKRDNGWNMFSFQHLLTRETLKYGNGGITPESSKIAAEIAMLPTLSEEKSYQILSEHPDAFFTPFGRKLTNDKDNHLLGIWAPLVWGNQINSAALVSEMQNILKAQEDSDPSLKNDPGFKEDNPNAGVSTAPADDGLGGNSTSEYGKFAKSMFQNFEKFYLKKLSENNAGINGESIFVAKIPNPRYHLAKNPPAPILQDNSTDAILKDIVGASDLKNVFLTQPSQFKSAWSETKDPAYRGPTGSSSQSFNSSSIGGRTGYSVRIVSLEDLFQRIARGNQPSALPPDLQEIKH